MLDLPTTRLRCCSSRDTHAQAMVKYRAQTPSKGVSHWTGPSSCPHPALPVCADDVELGAMLLVSLRNSKPVRNTAPRRKKKTYICPICGYCPKQVSDLKVSLARAAPMFRSLDQLVLRCVTNLLRILRV